MKKTRKFVHIFSVLLLYCFAVGFQSTHGLGSKEVFSKDYSDQKKSVFSLSTVSFVSYVSKTNSLVGYLFNDCHSSYDVFGLASCFRAAGLFLENKLSEYFSYSAQINIKLKRFDIIYPFHDFL